MAKFRGRSKRWNKKIRKSRWKTDKKEMLSSGWVEVGNNMLVPKEQAIDYPTYVPTHLGGKVVKGRSSSLYENVPGLPRRSEVRRLKKFAKTKGWTLRQFISGHW